MRITAELLRKKAEHNEGQLTNLEEIALHQLSIEKIENFDKLCRHIQILLLQNNLIEKMENLHKLKELKYLNLALNNIDRIENIESCESLEKLDLTCNFISCANFLQSLFNLKKCKSLKEIFLMGNPCTDFEQWKELIIALVSQLIIIDGIEIKPSERIEAKQNFEKNCQLLQTEIEKLQIIESQKTPEEKAQQFNKEHRKRMYEETKEEEELKNKKSQTKKSKISSKYFKNGDMRQCNEGKYKFKLFEYNDPQFTFFHFLLPKYLDTSFVDVEIFPNFISLRVKQKLTQVKLWEEVFINPEQLQRSKTSGELLIKLKKIKYDRVLERQIQNENQQNQQNEQNQNETLKPKKSIQQNNENEYDDIPDLEQIIVNQLFSVISNGLISLKHV